MCGTSECSSDTVFTVCTATIKIAQMVKIHSGKTMGQDQGVGWSKKIIQPLWRWCSAEGRSVVACNEESSGHVWEIICIDHREMSYKI